MTIGDILRKHTNLDDNQLKAFESFTDILLEWNERINLTAITDREEIAVKHYLDSLSLLNVMNPQTGASIIDIGTGAGFPAIPLLIARNDLKITMLDSLNKRLVFIREALDILNIEAETVHNRAEILAHDKMYREKYDYAVSRAVARLNSLAEYTLPFVKTGGFVFAMKGPDADMEVEEAETSIKILGGSVEKIHKLNLPDGSQRSIVQIRKIAKTPLRFPRQGIKISKKPL